MKKRYLTLIVFGVAIISLSLGISSGTILANNKKISIPLEEMLDIKEKSETTEKIESIKNTLDKIAANKTIDTTDTNIETKEELEDDSSQNENTWTYHEYIPTGNFIPGKLELGLEFEGAKLEIKEDMIIINSEEFDNPKFETIKTNVNDFKNRYKLNNDDLQRMNILDDENKISITKIYNSDKEWTMDARLVYFEQSEMLYYYTDGVFISLGKGNNIPKQVEYESKINNKIDIFITEQSHQDVIENIVQNQNITLTNREFNFAGNKYSYPKVKSETISVKTFKNKYKFNSDDIDYLQLNNINNIKKINIYGMDKSWEFEGNLYYIEENYSMILEYMGVFFDATPILKVIR